MRELTSLRDEKQAGHLASFLAVQGIESKLDQDDGGEWVIWYHNDDDRDKAIAILEEFQQNPDDAKYANAERKVRHVLVEASRLQEERLKAQERQRKRASGSWWHRYPATYIMIGLCIVIVAVCTQWNPVKPDDHGMPKFCNRTDSRVLSLLKMSNESSNTAYWKRYGMELQAMGAQIIEDQNGIPVKVINATMPELTDVETKQIHLRSAIPALLALTRTGEIWRFMTPAFIHLSLIHIAMNMMAFRNLGCGVEYIRGTGRYLMLCLILAVTSSAVQFLWDGPGFGGMSGVLFGLVGYIWIKGKTRPQQPLSLSSRGIVFALFWLILCMTGALGNIANGAHVGGFLVGMLCGAREAVWQKFGFRKTDAGDVV